MSDSEAVQALNTVLSKLERLGKLQLWIISLTAAGVLWGGKLEWRAQDAAARLDKAEVKVEQHGLDIAVLKARRGISAAVEPDPHEDKDNF